MKYYRKKERNDNFNYENAQKCWTCKNACNGGCCWSDRFEPVPGWKAEKSVFWDCGQKVETYKIIECPLYKFG